MTSIFGALDWQGKTQNTDICRAFLSTLENIYLYHLVFEQWIGNGDSTPQHITNLIEILKPAMSDNTKEDKPQPPAKKARKSSLTTTTTAASGIHTVQSI